jgi:hypothetical protein
MASIDKRTDGSYRARWREYPGGPQKTRQFARKSAAQTFLDGVRGDLAKGVYIDPAGARTLFQEYAESWRAAQVHRPSTTAQAETYLRSTPTQRWVRGQSAPSSEARSRLG